MNALQNLLMIIETLRAPDGCMWDRKQTKKDVARYLIEEAYEVVDAIHSGSSEDLKEELGDLLFQILFLVKISEERDEFNISDVIREISEKMIRRHPHVFGDKKVSSIEEIKVNWNDIKVHEEGKPPQHSSPQRGVPRSLPSLLRAHRITENASRIGFDWDDTQGAMEKIDEELEELKNAIASQNNDRIKEEVGDILFSLVNVSRFVNVNPEEALTSTIGKFLRRFSVIEKQLREQDRTVADASLDEMDELWDQAKKNEKR